MDSRIVCIYGKKDVEIVCPRCMRIGSISCENIPRGGKEYKLKCKCGESSIIQFEKRRHLRKSLNSIGVISNNGDEYIVNITGLSLSGCSFTCRDDRLKLNAGDKIRIRFRLDNANSDMIESSAIIRNIRVEIGIEFIDTSEKMKKTLAFYFM